MARDDSYFWISSLLIVLLSFYVAEIDPLVNLFFGGYLGFIKGSLAIGNPVFVAAFLLALYRLLGRGYLDFYVQFFINANLVWLSALPALYLTKYYDLKTIIIVFCAVYAYLAPYIADHVRRLIRDKKLGIEI